ncbi:MAG: hypothetical protein EBS49_00705 [Verrucomicrobia bacterium]|nr:hypothetical protein [Verrucomicrobiota bacterium]
MRSLQDWVYDVEAGPLRAWLVRFAVFLAVAGLAAWIGLREFNGLRTFEAMDAAQQARQIAQGKGFTTLLIRPLALWQVRSNLGEQAPAVTSFPETLNPPLYPLVLAAFFKVGMVTKTVPFDLSGEALKGFRVFPPDQMVLLVQLGMLIAATFAVYAWAQRQFDVGTGVLAVAFFLGSSPLWTHAVSGGATLASVFLYAISGLFVCLGVSRNGEDGEEEGASSILGWFWLALAGFLLGISTLVQMVHFWPVLGAAVLAAFFFRSQKWPMLVGLFLALGLFAGWILRLWLVTRNPIGLNWGFLLADSGRFPGEMVWRTYSFESEKAYMWQRAIGSVLRGFTDLLSRGPAVFGNAIAGTLAVVACLHGFRRPSAAMGRNLWAGVGLALLVATSFVQRANETEGHPILMALLPAVCVYGAAYFWVLIERWRLPLELLGRLFATAIALVAAWPVVARMVLPEPGPFAYPPTYPPIFLFMRSWFEPGELQASDLPAAEAWYAAQPTLWLPTTRSDFLKIHDRVKPVFSILLTPESSDARMYSQILAENSEWHDWGDLIRRQKPPDLPQAFATSLPPNNEYLLLSTVKRWN